MRFVHFRAFAALLLGIAVVASGAGREARAELPRLLDLPDDSRVCGALARAAEKALGIPEHLLRAVGVVESGRYDRALGRAEPWPWTINAAGKGSSFRAKADAIAEVEALRRTGVASIDVGCMQVNLAYHGDAFESLEEAFDPVMNVAYAAHFLHSLKEERGSWSAAVAAYHSSTPERGIPYRRKVATTWHGIRGAIAQDAVKLRRAAVLEAYQKRRAEFAAHQARVLKIQQERRQARKRKRTRTASENGGVVELRGGVPATAAPSASLPADRDEKSANGVVGEFGQGDRRLIDEGRDGAAVARVASACGDTTLRSAAGRAKAFDPKLAQQILEISAQEEAASEVASDGFVLERDEMLDDPGGRSDRAIEVVHAGAGPTTQDPGPLSSVDAPEVDVARAARATTEAATDCARLIERKSDGRQRRAKTPSIVRG